MGSLKNNIRTMTALIKLTVFLCLFILQASSLNLAEIKKQNLSAPRWESLCDKGHKYLFSEETVNWNDAREMCQLLGGYLARIENRHENNCILAFAQTNQLHTYWWHSGNDVDIEGIYKMDNGSEMQWVSNFCYMDGAKYDALLIRTYNDVYARCWQDYPISHGAHYICEKND